MAQKIRRGRKVRKLEPPLPETKDELNLPKYFGMIRGSGLGRKEDVRETIPELMARPKEVPKTIPTRRSLTQITQLPNPKPELERMPWIVRITKRFKSILKIEPEREMMAGLQPKTKVVPKNIVTKASGEREAGLPEQRSEPEKVPVIIKRSREFKAGLNVEPEREEVPGLRPKTKVVPKNIVTKASGEREAGLPEQRSEPEKVPVIIKRSREFKAGLNVEPEREEVPGLRPKTKVVPKNIVTKASGEREAGLPEQRSEPEKVPVVIKRSREFKAGLNVEPEREVVSGLRPKTKEVPKLVRTDESKEPVDNFPNSKPESEKMPLILRMAKRFMSALKVEPERPTEMPVVPELSFPPLYTRYPMMRTVTKTTDTNGKITVTFDHLFMEVPGVVLTIKGSEAYYANVTDVTLTNFEAIFFKAAHDHGGVVVDGGIHTTSVNSAPQHRHGVEGTITWDEYGNYGRLVLANYTDYEKDHTHKAHTSPGLNYTGYENGHTHSFGTWSDDADATTTVIESFGFGSSCVNGYCVDHNDITGVAVGSATHGHYVGGTTDAGSMHRHLMGETGPVDDVNGHRHLISNDDLYDHYLTHISIDAFLSTSGYQDPSGANSHTTEQTPDHDHGVAEDGDALLKNTQVTVTYLAQVES